MQLKDAKSLLMSVPSIDHPLTQAEWPSLLSHEAMIGLDCIPKSTNGNQELSQLPLFSPVLPKQYVEATKAAPFFVAEAQKFNFIDLFSGIGGFRLALQQQSGKCVFSSEWDNAAQDTYFRNFGEIPFGDIRQFTNDNIENSQLDAMIPDHEVLAAGFPCQPFSRAGVSARNALKQAHGFDCSSQGTLFYDVARIAKVKKPKALFLENVRNILSHDKGHTFATIKSTLEEIGYSFSYAVINAQSLVPQKRVRCYMVAIRNDLPKFEFDLTPFEGDPIPLSSILEPEEVTKEYRISERLWRGHQSRTERNLSRGTGFTALEADINKPANTLVARYGKDGKECLIPTRANTPRKLTKREAARLQGFPENFILPASKTPTYKQMGNSVAVPVVTEIAAQIIQHLEINNGL